MDAVKEGNRSTLSSGRMVALAAGLSVGATVGYMVYRHLSGSGSAQPEEPEEARMSVPLQVYRNISRGQATFLELVSQKSGAQVKVSESGDPGMVCFLLQGSPQQVLLARCTLENLAADCESTTEVFHVPHTAFGRIIGRGGESLKLITRTTGARVVCPKERGRGLEEKGPVTITGTRREVRQAKELIMEKVREDMAVRRKISQSSALRQKRRPQDAEGQKPEILEVTQTLTLNNNNGPHSLKDQDAPPAWANGTVGETGHTHSERPELPGVDPETTEEEVFSPDSLSEVSKFEIPSPDLSFQPDEHLEVYVSAVENPGHFWIQILGVRSLQLDKLTEEMSRFYSNGTLPEQRVETIVVGDIVAAPYQDHGTWNRARVLGILGSGLVDLYYVDFGDNGDLPRDSLRSMRSDFLSLPFQAMECSLAGVKPAGETWTEAALDDFDKMTYCAAWRPLLAKLCSYSHSEIASWPSVKLYDNTEGKAMDLGEELILLGHAEQCQDTGTGREDRDDPGCLQRMLDDVTGATSELSLSCISLSGSSQRHGGLVSERREPRSFASACTAPSRSPSSPELQRADVDGSPSSSALRYGLAHSTPGQLCLAELLSEVTSLYSSSASPSPLQLRALSASSSSSPSASTLSSTSSSSVEVVTSGMGLMAIPVSTSSTGVGVVTSGVGLMAVGGSSSTFSSPHVGVMTSRSGPVAAGTTSSTYSSSTYSSSTYSSSTASSSPRVGGMTSQLGLVTIGESTSSSTTSSTTSSSPRVGLMASQLGLVTIGESTSSSSSSSMSSSSAAGAESSGSMGLGDSLFLDGSSYDADMEDGEETETASGFYWSSGLIELGESCEEEEEGEEEEHSSSSIISVSSTSTHSHQEDGGGGGERDRAVGVGVARCSRVHSVVRLIDSSSEDDVVYVGSIEPQSNRREHAGGEQDPQRLRRSQAPPPPGRHGEDEVVPPRRQDQVVPPGREDEVVPPGREDEVVPPGREDEVVPPGREDEVVPPGREDEVVEPGREDEVVEPGREDEVVQPGREDEVVEPGREDEVVEPGREDEVVEPGREDEVVEPGREDEVVEPGREDEVVEPGREDEVVEPGREDDGTSGRGNAAGTAEETMERLGNQLDGMRMDEHDGVGLAWGGARCAPAWRGGARCAPAWRGGGPPLCPPYQELLRRAQEEQSSAHLQELCGRDPDSAAPQERAGNDTTVDTDVFSSPTRAEVASISGSVDDVIEDEML